MEEQMIMPEFGNLLITSETQQTILKGHVLNDDVVEVINTAKSTAVKYRIFVTSLVAVGLTYGTDDNKHCGIDTALRPDQLFNDAGPESGLRKWKITRVS